MVKVYSETGGFPLPDRPRTRGGLEYRFDDEIGGHHIRELREIDLEKRKERISGIRNCIGVGLFSLISWLVLFAIQSSEGRPSEGKTAFALYAGALLAIVCAWVAWDLWKKHVAEVREKDPEIEIYPTHIQIKRYGSTLYYPREKVISAYVTADGALAELERQDEDEHCDLLIFYWREHAELLWIAELVDRVLILGETPVETPPPIAGDV